MSLKRGRDDVINNDDDDDDDKGNTEDDPRSISVKRPPTGNPPSKRPRPEQPEQQPEQSEQVPATTDFLKVPPRDDSSCPSVSFQKPSIITTFSYTSDRELAFDDSAMKYFVQPPVRADLGYRYSRWTKRPDEKGRLDNLLRALAATSTGPTPFEGAVSWRGVMCKYANSMCTHMKPDSPTLREDDRRPL